MVAAWLCVPRSASLDTERQTHDQTSEVGHMGLIYAEQVNMCTYVYMVPSQKYIRDLA